MSDPLRIALVTAFPPGRQSLNEYGLHLARGFARNPDVAEVVVLGDRLEMPQPEADLGPKLRIRRVWSFNSLGAMPSILAALRAERPDGVVYNLQTASFGDRELPAALGLMTPMLSRAAGTPSGVIAHNIVAGVDLDQTLLKGRPLRQAVVRAGGAAVTRALVSASYVTVTLNAYAALLAQSFPRADVSVIPHGTFDTAARALAPSNARPMRLVTMGKFGTYKRLETLLRATDILRRDPALAELELVIGGSDHPNTPGYLDRIARSRSGDGRTRFVGYIAEDRIAEFFSEARVSVFDYAATTGSSGVLHQTASYGAVPVFPRIGDFVDLCDNEGLSGVHYRPGDAAGMAAAIRSILEAPEVADRIARTNRDAAEGMPFSDVIQFHVDRIRALRNRGGPARPLPGTPVSAQGRAP